MMPKWLPILLLAMYPFGMAIGQCCFKRASQSLHEGVFMGLVLNVWFITAIGLYVLLSLAWPLVLSRFSLVFAYPIALLSVVLVPILAHYVFGERVTWQYFLGSGLVILGVVIAATAGSAHGAT